MGRKIVVIILVAAAVIGAALLSAAQAPAARGLSDAELAAVKGGAQCRCLKSKKCHYFCFVTGSQSSYKCDGEGSLSTCVTANSQSLDCSLNQYANCGTGKTTYWPSNSCSGEGTHTDAGCQPKDADGTGDACPPENTSIMSPGQPHL